MRSALLIGALLVAALLFTAPSAQAQDGIGSLIDSRVVFPASASQGALVIGKVPAGSRVQYAGRQLRVSGYGSVVFGIGRDEKGPLRVQVQRPDGGSETATIAVTPRDWPTERVNGVPPKTVNPPPAIAERIKREQAQVTAARARDDDRTDFTQTFIWPVQGRISGRFGNARVYNGQPGAGHSGMDIAVPTGTPVKAPAAIAGCRTSRTPTSWPLPWTMPTSPAGRPCSLSTCCTRANTRAESSRWPVWALTTTEQPAASADAVSPPSTEKANGKLLAENIATGPSGTCWRTIAGWPAGGGPGIAGSFTWANGTPRSAMSAKRRNWNVVRSSSPFSRARPSPVS